MEISKLKVGDSAFGAIPTYNGAFQKGWKVKKFIVVRKSAKMIEVICPDCKRTFKIPLIKHHFITKDLRRYLINVAKYDRKQIEKLRRMLFIYICKECEGKFHNKTD